MNSTMCSIEGCERKRDARGFCGAHYMRWKRYGDPLGGGAYVPKGGRGICSIEGCTAKHLARGWCTNHYARWLRHGDPLGGGEARQPRGAVCHIEGCCRSVFARNYCALHYGRWWRHGDASMKITAGQRNPVEPGYVKGTGYRRVWINGRDRFEHIVVAEAMIGRSLRPDEVVHHINRDRLDNRQENLVVMTASDHARLHNPRRTHCQHGHELTPANIHIPADGRRRCLACKRERAREYQRAYRRRPDYVAMPRDRNWKEARLAVLQRDGYRCQSCGLSQHEDGALLDIHHRVPFAAFSPDRISEANTLENLVTLCDACHVRWERQARAELPLT